MTVGCQTGASVLKDNSHASASIVQKDSCDDSDQQFSWIDRLTDLSDMLFNFACVQWKLRNYPAMCGCFQKCLIIENEIVSVSPEPVPLLLTTNTTGLHAGTTTKVLFAQSRLLRDILNDPDFAGIELRQDILEYLYAT